MRVSEAVNKQFLISGSLVVERQPTIIQTVLGSCIAVCLFDQSLKFGGMNHFMLPVWKGDTLASPKYGNIATEKLVEKMLALGASKSHLVAKVFGGANQLDNNNRYQIGERNTTIAMSILQRYGIPVVSSDVGGGTGRKILFETHTGSVFMKLIKTE